MTASTIARLRITLDDVKPIVQRRVEVPLTMRLDRKRCSVALLACSAESVGLGWRP